MRSEIHAERMRADAIEDRKAEDDLERFAEAAEQATWKVCQPSKHVRYYIIQLRLVAAYRKGDIPPQKARAFCERWSV